jgi:hypothetical protein
MAQDDLIDFELFRYTPSQAAAGLFAGLFFITTLFHLYQVYKSRAWYFIPFVVGGVCKNRTLSTTIKPRLSSQACHANAPTF